MPDQLQEDIRGPSSGLLKPATALWQSENYGKTLAAPHLSLKIAIPAFWCQLKLKYEKFISISA